MNIETIDTTPILYMRRTGAYGTENAALMARFKDELKKQNLFKGATILGIAQDDPTKTTAQDCRYDVCLLLNKDVAVSHPFKRGRFEGGKFAVFKLEHTAESISAWYLNLENNIIQYRLNPRNFPIIERYKNELIEQGFCEMLLPIT